MSLAVIIAEEPARELVPAKCARCDRWCKAPRRAAPAEALCDRCANPSPVLVSWTAPTRAPIPRTDAPKTLREPARKRGRGRPPSPSRARIAALLADGPEASNAEVARRTGVSPKTVHAVRVKLIAEGTLPPRLSASERVERALKRDHARHNKIVAEEAHVHIKTVGVVRRRLLRAGELPASEGR